MTQHDFPFFFALIGATCNSLSLFQRDHNFKYITRNLQMRYIHTDQRNHY